MTSALDDLAATADETAADQRRIAHLARTARRRRAQGWSWAQILDREEGARLVELLRQSGRRIAETAAGFTRSLAAELRSEGASHRAIASRLGVSHQRVSAMLDDHRRSGASAG